MPFKILRPICAGLDIHKDLIVATIGITDMDKKITDYHTQEFSTKNYDLINLADWLSTFDCKEVAMESTGKYWFPIWNYLEQDFDLCIANPKYTRAISGKKTDLKDSKWICNLFMCDMLPSSFIPSKEIRAMRELSRYRIKLTHMQSSEKNRYQNCLTASNISIGSLFSDPLGKSAQAVLGEVLKVESENLDKEKIRKLVNKKCKNRDTIYEDLLGYDIQPDQRLKLKACKQNLDSISATITEIENELFVRAYASFSDEVKLLTTVPGIQPLSAITILSEIGADMSQFKSADQLACWCGLSPASNESAHKKKSVRINKAGQFLKPQLVQCALAAVKSTREPYFRQKYYRIKKRRGHKKAIIAIARMMIVCIYHMLLKKEAFHPDDYSKIEHPKKDAAPASDLTIESAMEFLKNSGYDVSVLKAGLPAQTTG